MDLVALTEYLVKSIVKQKDMVSVKQFEDDEEYITIQVLVDSSDMGAVIGKNGINANALRTLVQASSYINGLKKVKINIDSF
ncbi:MAG: KH domain-containing protein [Tenericutes bacterium]|nr:KH domain-containing protein [Mycoplasmatota bacterium]